MTNVAELLLARDLWQIGECDCVFDASERNLRIFAFPNAGHSDTSMDINNRVAVTQVAGGGDGSGRKSCCVTEMPRWVAEGLAAGLIVGGTCVTCGSLTTIEVDLAGETSVSAGTVGAVQQQGRGSEPPRAAERGERFYRGWGKQPRKRERTRRVSPDVTDPEDS